MMGSITDDENSSDQVYGLRDLAENGAYSFWITHTTTWNQRSSGNTAANSRLAANDTVMIHNKRRAPPT